ncbi:type II secretion system protein GspL [Acinetobacter radioresistens]|jgi:general secretion pathway protein L|uniref:Type II secretion system protein L n=1 Tax=Acinetobacter radioresistens TaxID=40216 RepID=A0A8H2PX09_ACIRA|nr:MULTISPECIES: type II secretion system protein GspL [Acinetobacter]ENV88033.1 type II secretion system protein L [Acinetobacter radioresistens NIPH 2130]ENV88728.1 type II secretion system protein L [Acinetobacter radioresistens DSM 6976 = NBRC 102413 = CIP 103788]EXB35279.1 type II secretion system (T2SS), L family protein [Acinetobacter sp. 1461402]EXB74033.1 type II secretion system (T2SS), L family protein [Acinetobacter sp. 230853]EXB86514.1 type II secretion system (T2SS), L family pr
MLYLWMPEANGVWQWSNGDAWSESSSLEQLIQEIKIYQGEEIVVFFPSRGLQLLQQQMSKSQYKQLGTEGVRYLLEEYVIQPIDQLKVLHYFQAAEERLTVMGVALNLVETLLHSLNLLPLKVAALLPDFLVLPQPDPGETILANIHQRLLARENEFSGNSIDELGVYLEFIHPETRFRCSGLSPDQQIVLDAVTTQEQRQYFSYQFEPIKKPKQHPFNILPKAQKSEQFSGYWKACAAVFCAILIVQLSYDVLRWSKLKKLADQTAIQAIDQYQDWFGPNSRITEENIQSQFESQLRMSRSANTEALQILSRVGPILAQQQILAERVGYESSILSLDLKASSSEQLQALTQQLNQQGFKAELGNVQTQGAGVIGLVKVQ